MKRRYRVPVTWEVCASVYVEAEMDDPKEEEEIFECVLRGPLPLNSGPLADSYRVGHLSDETVPECDKGKHEWERVPTSDGVWSECKKCSRLLLRLNSESKYRMTTTITVEEARDD